MIPGIVPRNEITRGLIKVPRQIISSARRTYYSRQSSKPFLSGDLFANESDISIYNSRNKGFQPSKKTVSEAKVIFCPSAEIERFLEEYKHSISAKVLIFGNSDRDFECFDHKLPKSVRRVFLQNSLFSDVVFKPLPIGIENIRLAKNGIPNLFHPKYALEQKKNEILIGPLGRTHIERDFVDSIDRELVGHWLVLNSRISPKKYALISSKYRYIAAPRGNGQDTHRFWEALYRGSIPIVKRSTWSDEMEDLGLPLATVADWHISELQHIIEKKLEQNFLPRDISTLWWPYWEHEISSVI